MHKLVQELRTTGSRAQNLASDWVDQEMTVPPEVSQEEESFVGESRQGQPSIVDLMEEIERLKGQVASLKGKARERPLPEGQEGQGSQTSNPMATGSDQGKGRKAASTGRTRSHLPQQMLVVLEDLPSHPRQPEKESEVHHQVTVTVTIRTAQEPSAKFLNAGDWLVGARRHQAVTPVTLRCHHQGSSWRQRKLHAQNLTSTT